jgi:molybdopterin-binding protein
MPQYRVSRAARLMGVSPDTMRRWADAGKVKSVQGDDGHRYIDGGDLARLAIEIAGEQDRTGTQVHSARNHISGIVTRVTKDQVAAQVELQAGPYRLVALITREAVDDLRLEPGMVVGAVVKATSVSIELPPGG